LIEKLSKIKTETFYNNLNRRRTTVLISSEFFRLSTKLATEMTCLHCVWFRVVILTEVSTQFSSIVLEW